MPTTTVLPMSISSIPYPDRGIVTGAATDVEALSDGLDTSYVRRLSGTASQPVECFNMGDPTIPANNDVVAISPGIRAKADGCGVYSKMRLNADNAESPEVCWGGSATITEWTFAQVFKDNDKAVNNLPWSNARANNLSILIRDNTTASNANRAYFYKLYATVWYLPRLVATPQTTGTVTVPYPELSTIVDSTTTNDWKTHNIEIEWAAFTTAQLAAPGFDPATSPALWRHTSTVTDEAGVTLSATSTVTPDVAFPQSGDIRVYTRAKRAVASCAFREWTYTQFTMSYSPTDAPTVTAGPVDESLQEIPVDITPIAKTGHTDPLISVERFTDGVWVPVRGATRVAGTFGTAKTITDREAPRDILVSYRANVETTFGGVQLVSSWATSADVTMPATGWNLKCPENPGINLIDARVHKDPEHKREEDLGIFRPKGRTRPIVVAGALGGADGSFTITATDELHPVVVTEWELLTSLIAYQGVLLLESPFGWSRYIRIISRDWRDLGSAGSARHTVKVSYLEVAAP